MQTKSLKNAFLILTLLVSTGFAPPLLAADYLLGLSPNYSSPLRTNLLQELLLFLLEGAQPGDQIFFCDALQQRLVTKVVIPQGKLFESNARARAQRLGTEMVVLKNFVLADRPFAPELANAAKIPQFLDFAGTQLRRSGEPLRVVLLASGLYLNSDEPAYNMDDAFPSDAHLLADQRDSVYGTALKKGVLTGITVHLAYLRPQFINDFHQERIRRFWAAFIRLQSGALASFVMDPALALQRARANITEPCVASELDPNDTKIEMRQVLPRSVPIWFGSTNLLQEMLAGSSPSQAPATTPHPSYPQPPPPPPLSPTAPPAAPNRVEVPIVTNRVAPLALAEPQPTPFPLRPTSNQLGIGIMWSARGVDCDLYVRSHARASELYFRNTRSREGRYYHDYRNANAGIDYEFVELKPPADPSKVEAWVNYYAGRVSPVRGIVVVFYEGKSFYGTFEINASRGNAGADRLSRGRNSCWVRLDLVGLIKAGNQIRPAGATR